jgi:outer membrane protein assembly factor BamD
MGRHHLPVLRQSASWILLLAILLETAGCFWKKDVPEAEPTGQELYQEGLEQIRKKKFEEARELFNQAKVASTETDLELLAQIAVADSYFEEEEYEAARAQYEEIYKLHSGGAVADYLQYRIGECFFWQIDTIDRDTTNAKESLNAFTRLEEQYPESNYLPLARLRVHEIHTFLAESEFFIGQFYLRKNALFAAIHRFKKALELYPDSGIEDKLVFSLYQTYLALKDEDHAEEYRSLLLERYPNSEYIPQLEPDNAVEGTAEGDFDPAGSSPLPLPLLPDKAADREEQQGAVAAPEEPTLQEEPTAKPKHPSAGLAGTYQGRSRDSRWRRVLLLDLKESPEESETTPPDGAAEESEQLRERSLLDKIIPW